MYPRKDLDISPLDFICAMRYLLDSENDVKKNKKITTKITALWQTPKHVLVSLSVRSGFELLLTTLNLPEGSEVIITGITIPDIVKIIEKHKLKVVAVDMHMPELAIKIDELKKAVTSKTRMIIPTHLFGTRIPLDEMFSILKSYPDILVVEDCAEAFSGVHDYQGDLHSDIVMFSFGTIKFATALGGGVFLIKRKETFEKMASLQQQWPTMNKKQYLKKIMTGLFYKIIGIKSVLGFTYRLFKWTGNDLDNFLMEHLRGFKGGDFFTLIRRQPPFAMKMLLYRRLKNFGPAEAQRNVKPVKAIKKFISPDARIAGIKNSNQGNWLFSASANNQDNLIKEIIKLNIDATKYSTQLKVVKNTDNGIYPSECTSYMESIIYIPLLTSMSEELLKKIAKAINYDASNSI